MIVPCDDGFARAAAGDCIPAVPAEDCPAGTLPVVGAGECQPVGWTHCTDGFVPDPSGWGCTPVLADRCGDFEQAVPGHAACVPVGDCTAPFPPPDADFVVDDDFTSAELDGRRYGDLNDALQAAPSGSLIAIEAGEYRVDLSLARELRIAGRCPQQVRLFNGEADRPAVHVNQVRVELSGVSITGSDPGIAVERGGTLVLRDSVLAGNVTYGAYVFGESTLIAQDVLVRGSRAKPDAGGVALAVRRGSRAELTRVEVRDSQLMGVLVHETYTVTGTASSLVASQLVVRGVEGSAAGDGVALAVLDAGRAEVRSSVFERAGHVGLAIDGAGSRLILSDSVIRDVGAAQPTNGDLGVLVQDRAELVARRIAVVRCGGAGVLAHNPGVKLELTDSVVRQTRPKFDGRGDGVNVSFAASGVVRSVALVETSGVALYAGVDGASLDAERVLVTGTRGDFHGNSRGLSVEDGSAMLSESAFLQFTDSGVFVGGSAARADLDRVLISGVSAAPGRGTAGGLIARYGATARVKRSVIRGDDSICLAFSDSSGLLDGSLVSGCNIGLHVQDGSELQSVEAEPAELPRHVVAVTGSTIFSELGARVGTGNLPLPGALGK